MKKSTWWIVLAALIALCGWSVKTYRESARMSEGKTLLLADIHIYEAQTFGRVAWSAFRVVAHDYMDDITKGRYLERLEQAYPRSVFYPRETFRDVMEDIAYWLEKHVRMSAEFQGGDDAYREELKKTPYSKLCRAAAIMEEIYDDSDAVWDDKTADLAAVERINKEFLERAKELNTLLNEFEATTP